MMGVKSFVPMSQCPELQDEVRNPQPRSTGIFFKDSTVAPGLPEYWIMTAFGSKLRLKFNSGILDLTKDLKCVTKECPSRRVLRSLSEALVSISVWAPHARVRLKKERAVTWYTPRVMPSPSLLFKIPRKSYKIVIFLTFSTYVPTKTLKMSLQFNVPCFHELKTVKYRLFLNLIDGETGRDLAPTDSWETMAE